MSARADLLEHLRGKVTTLARAWLITRRDGLRLGFTDHDQDIDMAGVLFKASTGLAAKALQSTTGLSMDNTEAMGALSDAAIDEADLAAGRYDGAEVTIWLLNWANPAQHMIEFKGSFGEVTRAGGAFKVDLRGQTDGLNVPLGRVYHSGCDAVLGGPACKFNLDTAGFRAEFTVQELGAEGEILLFGPASPVDDWFQLGRLTALTGQAQGLHGMVKTDKSLGSGARQVTLWQPFAAPLALGDLVQIEAGCDRSKATCHLKFNNIINFQGFPHIPGADWQISYPQENQPKDGGSLFR